jgi:hypothetical protein
VNQCVVRELGLPDSGVAFVTLEALGQALDWRAPAWDYITLAPAPSPQFHRRGNVLR